MANGKSDKSIAKSGDDAGNAKPIDAGTVSSDDAEIRRADGPTTAATGSASGNGAGGNGKRTGSGTGAIDPAILAGDAADIARDGDGQPILKRDGTPARKRGRKPGSGSGTSGGGSGTSNRAGGGTSREKSAKDNSALNTSVQMLAAQFQILNMGVAFMTKFDDFALEDAEAMQMAKSTAAVMEQFDYTPDPKIAAVLGLVTTTSMIYGPRIYLYRQHLEKRNQQRQQKRAQKADEKAATGRTDGGDGMNFSSLDQFAISGMN